MDCTHLFPSHSSFRVVLVYQRRKEEKRVSAICTRTQDLPVLSPTVYRLSNPGLKQRIINFLLKNILGKDKNDRTRHIENLSSKPTSDCATVRCST
ncbi:unnamed protein product [Soboliphyme baturini]|uniref:U-box domain-containing protein n=1 Tax=Soboliphyme baturini TaxID=241478 RepID=A0A183IUJ8_9BILA|nr:unnamed protein product [Soboliphyme baturini]